MKYEKIRAFFALLALVFVLPVVFSSCFAPELGEGSGSKELTEAPDQPSGYDYVLTEDDLALINTAWNEKYNVQMQKYRQFTTVEEAMKRNSRGWYYLGKYGDTVVIWYRNCPPDVKCCFDIDGYSFDFYNGIAYFFDNGVLYDNTDFPEGILTSEEAKDFHGSFTEYYLPLVRKDFAVLEYMPDLEIPSEEEMKAINDAYEKWYIDVFISHYSEDKAAAATKEAYSQMGYDPHRFFNDSKFDEYHYYGKIGDKVFIAVEQTTNYFTAYDVADFSFVSAGFSSGPLVYTDGVVTDLSEAHWKGIVSDAEVAEMHERYLAYYYYLAGGRKDGAVPDELKLREYGETYKSPIELSIDEIREIAWEYIDNERNLKSEHGVRCYGKFEGGAYAVMVDGPYFYTQAFESEDAADYRFHYHNGQKIRIYKDGVFYSINEAYLMGIISKSDVASIEWDKTVIQD